jgi:hypothetical protein
MDKRKYLYATIKNLNAKLCYPFIGLAKFGKTKLTIGEEVDKPVSVSEVMETDKMNYCIKYLRYKTPKGEGVLDNEKIETKIKQNLSTILKITTLGFVLLQE